MVDSSMKRTAKWLCVAAFAAPFAAPRPVHAQIPELGLKGGANLAVLGGKDAGAMERRTGFAFGAFLTVPNGSGRSVQAEALLTQKGARYGGASDSFLYLEAPVLYRISPVLPPAVPVKPVLYAGPTAGLLLRARMGDADAKHLYRSTDFGIALGGAVEFTRITLDARYQFGLTSIVKTIGQITPDYKHRVFSVFLGYKLF